MPGLQSLRIRRPGGGEHVLFLTDADAAPEVIQAVKVLIRHARTDVTLKLVDVRSGAIVATAKKEA